MPAQWYANHLNEFCKRTIIHEAATCGDRRTPKEWGLGFSVGWGWRKVFFGLVFIFCYDHDPHLRDALCSQQTLNYQEQVKFGILPQQLGAGGLFCFHYFQNQATLSKSVVPLPSIPASPTREAPWEWVRKQPGICPRWNYVLGAELHLRRKFSSKLRAYPTIQTSHMSAVLRVLAVPLGTSTSGLEKSSCV